MNDLASVVRHMREHAKLSKSELAAEMGTSRSVVARWENGTNVPSVLRFIDICRATGTEPETGLVWLLEMMEAREKD